MRTLILGLLLAAAPAAVLAQPAASDVYSLGELQVTARDRSGKTLGGSTITGVELQAFNRQTVDQALSLIPGTNATNGGGSRNEREVFVRGFDRFQTTISIDGVRVFLPADNRIDFARFLTADLSEIQVSKGYVSVLDGPGGLGGAINLVTIKPTAPIEAEVRAASFLDRGLKDEAYQVSGRVGGREGPFYWQVSGALNNRDHFTLSDKFTPTVLENGGERERSDSTDWRVNLKGGWQPNDTDEYSINFTRTEGSKNAPYHVSDTVSTRFWSWPYWNLSSVSLLTKTLVADGLVLRSRLYRNTFHNLLSSFDNAAQTIQSLPRAFNSFYDDKATGGNVELVYTLNDTNRFTAAFYARRDLHRERQEGFTRTPATGNPSANTRYLEPWQVNDEMTYSLAGEYNAALGSHLDLTVGASYDWTDLREANDANVLVTGTTIANSVISFLPVNYPLKNNSALNGQAALTWRLDEATRFHASVSDRTRFPTVFERFSARMGTAIPNPDVREERAISYEVGVQTNLAPGLELSGAAFYSDLKNALISIPVVVPTFGTVNQTKNAGDGHYGGFETSLKWRASDSLDLGGNYTHLHRKLIDPTNAAFRPRGVPASKLFAYADWRPVAKLSIRPSVEYASSRWTVTTVAPLTYYKTGAYTLASLSAEYAVTAKTSVTVAVQNIGDRDYRLTDGFPEAGRSFYVALRAGL
jgi:iron complex outermembrane receptor protein